MMNKAISLALCTHRQARMRTPPGLSLQRALTPPVRARQRAGLHFLGGASVNLNPLRRMSCSTRLSDPGLKEGKSHTEPHTGGEAPTVGGSMPRSDRTPAAGRPPWSASCPPPALSSLTLRMEQWRTRLPGQRRRRWPLDRV